MINTCQSRRRYSLAARGLLILAFGVCGVVGACQAPSREDGDLGSSAGGNQSLTMMPISERGGAQLWGDNCARCHNSRSPSEFDDDAWEVIARHMRVRANLTAYEHKSILNFLKSAN